MNTEKVRNEIGESWEEIDRIEGNLIYLKGHPYPWKGIPTIEGIAMANEVKTALKDKSIFQFLKAKVKLPQNPLPITKEIIKMTNSKKIAAIFEYDAAYRLRFQHLFSHSTKETLYKDIPKLLEISKECDLPEVHAKIAALIKIIPKTIVKWRIQKVNYANLTLDEADTYWLKFRTDYKYDRHPIK